uniref:Uncharacterized protein n=1 Tax=Noctiluca scintillans TaxID=2966 RepID=A0A7S1AVR0_NOCSC
MVLDTPATSPSSLVRSETTSGVRVQKALAASGLDTVLSPVARDRCASEPRSACYEAPSLPRLSSAARLAAIENSIASVCRDTCPGTSRKVASIDLDYRLQKLEEQITTTSHTNDSQVALLVDHAGTLEERLLAIRATREIHYERRQKGFRVVDNNMRVDFNSASQLQREAEARLELSAGARMTDLCEQFRKDRVAHTCVQEEFLREIGDEISRLGSALDAQRDTRVHHGDSIVARLETEFEEMQETLRAEQKLRSETQGALQQAVEDASSQLRAEIRRERDEREAVQGKLLDLLETTCSRIEVSVLSERPAVCINA